MDTSGGGLVNMIGYYDDDNDWGKDNDVACSGLTDSAEEGTFVWPSGLAGNYTWWDEDYGEPKPGKLREAFTTKQGICVEIYQMGWGKGHHALLTC